MKSLTNYIYILFALLLAASANALAIHPPEERTSVKGAATRAELTEAIYQAVKTNDFSMLSNYIPDEEQLIILKENSSTVEKQLYQNLNEQVIKENTQNNFDNIIKWGVENEINWATLRLIDNNSDKSSINNISTLHIVSQDNREQGLSFSVDVIKIINRWFILQGMRMVTPSAHIGSAE